MFYSIKKIPKFVISYFTSSNITADDETTPKFVTQHFNKKIGIYNPHLSEIVQF
jgi:hypothetical protein